MSITSDVNNDNNVGTDCQLLFQKTLPPSGNTGVENTSGLETFLDWFQFTLPTSDVGRVLSLLGLSLRDFVKIDRGLNGYTEQIRCGNIIVLSKGSPGMGVHVIMTGKGCREYEGRFGNAWNELIRGIFRLDGHFTRLDVAVDDLQGHFTLDMVREKTGLAEVRSVFKKASGIRDYILKGNGGVDGETMYYGSKTSSVRIRIYDKAKERGVSYFWNRTEIETRDERSNILASEIIGGRRLGVVVLGVLKRYLNFIEKSPDKNKSRWDVSAWWSGFLGAVEKVRLTIKAEKRTIEKVAGWIERQVSPSLALIEKKMGDSFESFMDYLIYSGRDRLKEKHLVILSGQ